MAVRPRADAARNRERLLDAALQVFTRDDTPTLESIAREAGVGIGTLYRHFPTRESLVEAVYRSELEALCTSLSGLLEKHPADEALRAWMEAYADFVATKREMGDVLRAVITSGAITSVSTRAQMGAAVAEVLSAGAEQGVLRADVRPEDVVASMAGALLAAGDRPQVGRLLDLVVDGLRRA